MKRLLTKKCGVKVAVVLAVLLGVQHVFAQACTLRVGAFQGDDAGLIGIGGKADPEEIVTAFLATAISKTTQKIYQSVEIDGLRYFHQLPQGAYRVVISKKGYKTLYFRHDLDCGDDRWAVSTWSVRLTPGNSKLVEDRDQARENVKTMLGSSDTGAVVTNTQPPPTISGGEAISLPEPRLSLTARNVDFTGFVKVSVFVNAEGKVTQARAVSGHPLLLADCETAAYYSKFSPRVVNGRPVSFFTAIRYPFGNIPAPRTISGGVMNGKALVLPKPAFPAAARAVRASGAVSVQVLISEDGEVISATAISGHPLLRAAAEEAARGARFEKTTVAGEPVKVSGVITYNFVP